VGLRVCWKSETNPAASWFNQEIPVRIVQMWITTNAELTQGGNVGSKSLNEKNLFS